MSQCQVVAILALLLLAAEGTQQSASDGAPVRVFGALADNDTMDSDNTTVPGDMLAAEDDDDGLSTLVIVAIVLASALAVACLVLIYLMQSEGSTSSKLSFAEQNALLEQMDDDLPAVMAHK
ncbi:hypothetical protein DIPPA_03036 [Diplonema papillatum]|nr:hypothetical protein DIPPA_03036 [Diplonema papillatum]